MIALKQYYAKAAFRSGHHHKYLFLIGLMLNQNEALPREWSSKVELKSVKKATSAQESMANLIKQTLFFVALLAT